MSAWSEFLEEVKNAKEELGGPESIWYRGHRDSSYSLVPSLLRYKNGLDKEQDLFYSFAQRLFMISEKDLTPWEILFEMQHYYVPTRLLDWTEVLGVATYFALLGNPESACVWLLNPSSLNQMTMGNPQPKKLDLEGFDYKKLYWEKKPVPPLHPVALEPPFKNVRIQAQRGMFTIHGDDTRPLEEICPECVRKIEISKATFPEMNDFFEFADLNEFKLFPDLHGIAPFLKKITGLE